MFYLLAQANMIADVDPQAIFGGAVLLLVLGLLVFGKLRLDREVDSKDEVVKIHEKTIDELRDTLRTLTTRDEATHILLQELRDMAYRSHIHEEMRPHYSRKKDGEI